mmetsp:Transcript_3226/g.9838  ORF Transcript_3226/g.9838 Transcript_3226/m.9838 type:complete len:232 (-) Transcript_3226:1989-2684(-)
MHPDTAASSPTESFASITTCTEQSFGSTNWFQENSVQRTGSSCSIFLRYAQFSRCTQTVSTTPLSSTALTRSPRTGLQQLANSVFGSALDWPGSSRPGTLELSLNTFALLARKRSRICGSISSPLSSFTPFASAMYRSSTLRSTLALTEVCRADRISLSPASDGMGSSLVLAASRSRVRPLSIWVPLSRSRRSFLIFDRAVLVFANSSHAAVGPGADGPVIISITSAFCSL